MIHWMLVLFMGGPEVTQAVKTDLVFATKTECFAYEQQRAEDFTGAANALTQDLRKKGASEAAINAAFGWSGMQFPRGTCIPTTSAVTLK